MPAGRTPLLMGGTGRPEKKVCLALDLHRGLPLRPVPLRARSRRDPIELYFETDLGRAIRDLADGSLLPAAGTLLRGLDQGLFLALSVSGTLVDLLERHAPDALAALGRVARHPGTEVLSAPYHHGLGLLYPGRGQLPTEVLRHRERMQSAFGTEPTVFCPPELCMTRPMADALGRTGCTAVLTDPRWCLLQDPDPTLVYRSGAGAVLLRHGRLSDDLATCVSPGRDAGPLAAAAYAGRLAEAPGECVLIGLDLDRLGDGSRFSGFIEALLPALERAGVETATPSALLSALPAEGLGPGREVRWTEPDEGMSWFETGLQRSAAAALVRASTWLPDREVWHHLSSTDHFRGMAVHPGGWRQAAVDHEATVETFARFMRALSALEERSASQVRSRKAAMTLRTLPPEQAFVFGHDGATPGRAAHSLAECLEMVSTASERVVAGHLARQDFVHWCRDVLDDQVLAERLARCRNRGEVRKAMQERVDELARRRDPLPVP